MVRASGVNWKLATLTAAVIGASDAVAEKVNGEPVSPSAVATMVIGPAAAPAVTVTDEIPTASAGTLAAETVPPVAVHPTGTSGTPFPNWSATLACTGKGSWPLRDAFC